MTPTQKIFRTISAFFCQPRPAFGIKAWALCLLFLSHATTVHSQSPLSLVFFYPGGQGSPQEAQPLLDEFAAGLEKASENRFKVTITYLQNSQSGVEQIQNNPIAAGIVASDFYYQNSKQASSPIKMEVLARTLQLPSADGTEQYFLIGPQGQSLPSSGTLSLQSSRPLDLDWLRQQVFPKLQALTLSDQAHPALVSHLRKIGSNPNVTPQWVVLDAFEWNNIRKLSAPWAKALQVYVDSEKVPSAPFVVFNSQLTPEQKTDLLKSLLKLGQDSQYRSTLEALRLKGFKTP